MRCGAGVGSSCRAWLRLRLVARFPESVRAGQQTLSGTVEVTSREAMRGVAPAAADVFLVREDRVVTTPVAQDAIGIRWELAAGETRTMPALASLVSCEPDGGPLPPGDYELYARVVVTPGRRGGAAGLRRAVAAARAVIATDPHIG